MELCSDEGLAGFVFLPCHRGSWDLGQSPPRVAALVKIHKIY